MPFVRAQVEVDPADELAAEHHVGGDERVIVGRVARARPTWPIRSSDCGAPGRGTMFSRAGCGHAPSAPRRRARCLRRPVAERGVGQPPDRLVLAIADRNQRRRAGTDAAARETRERRRRVSVASDRSLPSGVWP